jgi:hypothetical protein
VSEDNDTTKIGGEAESKGRLASGLVEAKGEGAKSMYGRMNRNETE